ncbi:hypothetical protein GCM10022419_102810 [Nonomuraea rosea]|uniref:Uncharacterized protein n=1 Tax=Nonomuraea rosea TaxID=638574 RepID=A0ABP6ZAY0_9ACTN
MSLNAPNVLGAGAAGGTTVRPAHKVYPLECGTARERARGQPRVSTQMLIVVCGVIPV